MTNVTSRPFRVRESLFVSWPVIVTGVIAYTAVCGMALSWVAMAGRADRGRAAGHEQPQGVNDYGGGGVAPAGVGYRLIEGPRADQLA